MPVPDDGEAAARRARREARWRHEAGRRGWPAIARLPLAWVYGALVALRHRLHGWGWLRSERLPVPVVVIGNLVAGGAGKTPATLAVVHHLQRQGWTPGVISRGHGRRSDTVLPVRPDGTAELVGDEPLLIARRTGVPVFVAMRRADAGRALLAAHPDVNVLVCDDGLQHRALEATVRLAVFDDRGVGNGWLLPSGLLREPWPPRGTQPVPDFIWQQTATGHPAPVSSAGRPVWTVGRRLADQAVAADFRTCTLLELGQGPLRAVAGIARPEVFFDMLRQAGLRPQRCIALPDHAGPAALEAALADDAVTPVVCTEKDLVKLASLNLACPVWAVPLVLDVPAEALTALDAALSPYHPAHGHQTA